MEFDVCSLNGRCKSWPTAWSRRMGRQLAEAERTEGIAWVLLSWLAGGQVWVEVDVEGKWEGCGGRGDERKGAEGAGEGSAR